LPDKCPNLRWPIWQNREITDPQELENLGYLDFKPKVCGADLSIAQEGRCRVCGRKISGFTHS
jgi:hypothetical protein